MQVVRCLHAAFTVADIERAEQFYSHVLGLPQVERPFNFPGRWYQIGEFQLHLIEDPNTSVQHPNAEKWGRNAHVALSVADLEAAKARLQQAGAPVQASASGRAALFAQDPDGNILELSQA